MIDPLQNPDFTRPIVESNLTVSDVLRHWMFLVKTYIDRFGGPYTYDGMDFLADGEYITLEAGTPGCCEVLVGDAIAHSQFTFSSTGKIILTSSTPNVKKTDSEGYLCIYWDGTNVIVKNSLGLDLNVRYSIKYNEV